MKITRIGIKNLYQFKDLNIDLTYPKGHEKEGLPLEKICIIGQSGTGKTNLLNIIRQASLILHEGRYPAYTPFEFEDSSGHVIVEFISRRNDHGVIRIDQFGYSLSILGSLADSLMESLSNYGMRNNPHVFYFPSTVHTNVSDFNINTSQDSVERYRYRNSHYTGRFKKNEDETVVKSKLSQYYIFETRNLNDLWEKVKSEIANYKQEEANFRIALTHEAEIKEINIKKSINEWKAQNLSPLERIAREGLDDILNVFHLKVKSKLEKLNEIKTIQIEKLIQEKVIDFENLSSGTKQIILTALPLFIEKPFESIILMDEPENSLYPDIQRKIVSFYTSFGDKNQYYFATHSPIIASSFEPWEVLELKFADEDNVKQEQYFKRNKERHVDNYEVDPRMLTWDSILRKVFDLDEEGNSDFRTPKLMELASIEQKLNHLKGDKESNKEQIAGLWSEYKKLAELLDWKID